jgi:hypothetical protein
MKPVIKAIPALAAAVLLLFACAMEVPDPRDDSSDDPVEELPPVEDIPAIEELPPFEGLAGTTWLWGQSLLEFNGESGTVRFRGRAPDYNYTLDGGFVAGQSAGGTITTLGAFTINAERDTLEILNYRGNYPATGTGELEGSPRATYNAEFHRKDPALLTAEFLAELSESTVVGTEWNVGAMGDKGTDNGARFKICQWIIFFTEDEAVNQSGDTTQRFVDTYTFDREKRRCDIYFINDFTIYADWDSAVTQSYKQYNHSMAYARVW